MNALVWNVRGLNNPSKQYEVRNQIKKCKANLVCLVETRIKECNFSSIKDRFLPGWGCEACFSDQQLCRIWLLWKTDCYQVTIMSRSSQSLHCWFQLTDMQCDFFLTFIYAMNDGMDRRKLWSDLEIFQSSIVDAPWLLARDFNVIKDPSEKLGGLVLNSYEHDLLACTESIGVEDHPAVGCYYTWTNRREDGVFVVKKLDRVLVNHHWLDFFPQCIVQFLPPGISDHSLAHISIGGRHDYGPKPFKFFNIWTEHKDFLTWIEEAWSTDVAGSPMFMLYSQLKAAKAKLKGVNKDLYGCISQKVLIVRQKLESIQQRLLQKNGEVGLRNIEQDYLHEFSALQKAEEAFMKQKARNKWLNLGDHNSRFFHCQVKARQARNAIK